MPTKMMAVVRIRSEAVQIQAPIIIIQKQPKVMIAVNTILQDVWIKKQKTIIQMQQ